MKPYNGHRSFNAWNISLWISSDEPLYLFALDCLQTPTLKGNKPTLAQSVRRFMDTFDGEKTPDGVLYTATNVRHALANLIEEES
jgi:hypothetical protein